MWKIRRDIFAIAVALASLLAGAAAPTPVLAANSDACGAVTQHTIAKTFGQASVIEHKALLRDAGNAAGVIQERCEAFAYRGPKPTTSAKRQAALLAGTGTELKIETWVADSGPASAAWLANFPRKLEALRVQAKAQFIEGPLGGSTYNPPRFGAEASIGYQGSIGSTGKIRALWWDRNSGTLILVNGVEDRGKPLRSSLRSLMSAIVPAVR